MKKITCLYDKNDWAIYNLLKLIEEQNQGKYNFDLINYKEFYKNPYPTDIIYVTFLFLHNRNFPYRKYGKEIICSVHDPSELTNFRNKYNWLDYPLRFYDFNQFDRVSAVSTQIQKIIIDQYHFEKVYHTPTFYLFKSSESPKPILNDKISVFSSTNLSRYYSFRNFISRFQNLREYFFDQNKNISLRQLKSIFNLETRKNIQLLKKIKSFVASDDVFLDKIRFGPNISDRKTFDENLRGTDIYICTSFMEGGPIPLAEAAANGAAILSTKVGQVSSILKEGENGFYCTTCDDFISKLKFYEQNRDLLNNHKSESVNQMNKLADGNYSWEKFLNGR